MILRFAIGTELWGWLILPDSTFVDIGTEEHMSAIRDYAATVEDRPTGPGFELHGADTEGWYNWFLEQGGIMIRSFSSTMYAKGEFDIDFNSEAIARTQVIHRVQKAITDHLNQRMMVWQVRFADWTKRGSGDVWIDSTYDSVEEFLNA